MSRIYHLVLPEIWQAAAEQPYRAASLDSEGFIHCSFAEQVAAAANRFYAAASALQLLVIDPAKLTSSLKTEPSGSGELFPHMYGPLNRDAVVEVRSLRRGPGGLWIFEA